MAGNTRPTRRTDAGLTPQESIVRVSFAGVHPVPTANGLPQQQRALDFSNFDGSSTYSALSSCVRILREAGSRHSDFVSRDELDIMIRAFEAYKVDLSDIMGFPYDAEDLGDCVLLLARLQNRLAMQGVRCTSCSLREMMEDTLLDRSNKNHRYDIGEWIEVRESSMKYRLERIEDVNRISNVDGDADVFIYETAVDHKLTENIMRWPQQALQGIFGMAPWVWRQWACLKIENKLKFKEGHPDDFEMLDIRLYAQELWELWLADQRNVDFRNLYERVGTSGQEELLNHIMSPFKLMQEVVTNADDQWNLEDAEVSMFTYVSVLGTGFFDSLIVFFLQAFIPCILFLYYTSHKGDVEEIQVGTREMLFAVLVYYLHKLNRDLWTNFNRVVGTSQTTSSRIRSLRRITWEEGNDDFFQSMGYTGDVFMNVGYICLLYLFNMWILFNVSDPFELLGSVIFFQFLFDLDEEIAQSSWWDKNKRYLRAGILSNILQNTIQKSVFADSETYLRNMGASLTKDELDLVRHRFKEAGLPTDRDFVHGSESDEGHLLTVAERVERLRRIESKATLPDEYIERSKERKTCTWQQSIFKRHEDLHCWSQLEVLLFAFPTPKVVPPDYVPGTKLKIPEEIAAYNKIKESRLFAPGKTNRERFFRHTLDVITCRYTSRNFQSGSETNADWFRFTRFLHALATWTSYALQLSFPFFSIAAVLLVYSDYYCDLHLGDCIFAEPRLQYSGNDGL